MAKIATEKVKIHVKVQGLTDLDLDFHFFSEILLSSMNLVIFSLLGGTSSILRTFLGGTSKKKKPVDPSDQIPNLRQYVSMRHM